MMNNPKPISDYLLPGKRAHLVGIGGVSMCPLAEVLAGKGILVQGSDMTESNAVKNLRAPAAVYTVDMENILTVQLAVCCVASSRMNEYGIE